MKPKARIKMLNFQEFLMDTLSAILIRSSLEKEQEKKVSRFFFIKMSAILDPSSYIS